MRLLALLLMLLASPALAQPLTPYGPLVCDSSASYSASTSGLTQVVALRSDARIYVCNYVLNVGAVATNVGLSYGSGTNCATGTTALTPAYVIPASGTIVLGGAAAGLTVPAGNALCVSTSGANPVNVSVLYFQHPGS